MLRLRMDQKRNIVGSELVEKGMHTNMFTILYVSAMPIKRNKSIMQLLKTKMARKIII